MKAVYSYAFPEVWDVVNYLEGKLALSGRRLFMTQTSMGEAQDIVDQLGFKTPLILPAKPDGTVDLDGLHAPVMEQIVEEYKNTVPGLGDFKYRYATAGSSEAIFHTIAELGGRDYIEYILCPGNMKATVSMQKQLELELKK